MTTRPSHKAPSSLLSATKASLARTRSSSRLKTRYDIGNAGAEDGGTNGGGTNGDDASNLKNTPTNVAAAAKGTDAEDASTVVATSHSANASPSKIPTSKNHPSTGAVIDGANLNCGSVGVNNGGKDGGTGHDSNVSAGHDEDASRTNNFGANNSGKDVEDDGAFGLGGKVDYEATGQSKLKQSSLMLATQVSRAKPKGSAMDSPAVAHTATATVAVSVNADGNKFGFKDCNDANNKGAAADSSGITFGSTVCTVDGAPSVAAAGGGANNFGSAGASAVAANSNPVPKNNSTNVTDVVDSIEDAEDVEDAGVANGNDTDTSLSKASIPNEHGTVEVEPASRGNGVKGVIESPNPNATCAPNSNGNGTSTSLSKVPTPKGIRRCWD